MPHVSHGFKLYVLIHLYICKHVHLQFGIYHKVHMDMQPPAKTPTAYNDKPLRSLRFQSTSI